MRDSGSPSPPASARHRSRLLGAGVGAGRPAAEVIDLTNTAYAPEEGTDGGTIIIGDWQEANQFNPCYLGQVTEANVASAAWASLVVLHPRLPLRA